ncbi:MAG: ABC transporter substrate-binding protein, partial [Deltaproteobacteria bacterium]|nr:ABC transporter substrate-binding protein [Deltaproteobacteria bacterium]
EDPFSKLFSPGENAAAGGGSYTAGAMGEERLGSLPQEVAIGVNLPLTGPYAGQAKDQQRGYELAAEALNEKGGVLSRTVVLEIRDTQARGDLAGENADKLILEESTAMITGGATAPEALAQSAVCQEQGTIFMAAMDNSNSLTGHMITPAGFTVQSAHRHTFRWFLSAWMTGQALGRYMMKEFGTDATYFYVATENSWGFALEDTLRRITEIAGADHKGTLWTEAGTADYTSQIKAAAEAGPDVLVLLQYGPDLEQALKAAHQLGVGEDMKIVAPVLELHMAKKLGPEVIEGVTATTTWYWALADKYEGSRRFVKAFLDKYGQPPGVGAACAWVAVHQWADAVAEAQDFYADDRIILALEGHKFTLLKDEETWRDWDHQCVSSVLIVRGKGPDASTGPWDLLEVVDTVPGSEVVRSREENPVSLESLVIEE